MIPVKGYLILLQLFSILDIKPRISVYHIYGMHIATYILFWNTLRCYFDVLFHGQCILFLRHWCQDIEPKLIVGKILILTLGYQILTWSPYLHPQIFCFTIYLVIYRITSNLNCSLNIYFDLWLIELTRLRRNQYVRRI